MGRYVLYMHFKIEDLPAPLGPIMARNSPLPTLNEILLNAGMSISSVKDRWNVFPSDCTVKILISSSTIMILQEVEYMDAEDLPIFDR